MSSPLISAPNIKQYGGWLLTVALLAGCGSNGGGGSTPPAKPPSTTSISGAAFVPGGSAASKALAGAVPFVGATVKVTSLRDGQVYPQTNAAVVHQDGSFSINGVPFGQDYLVSARKGNLVVMRLISIPDDAGASIAIGDVDAASTAAMLLAEGLIKEALGVNVDLRSGVPGGVDANALHNQLSDADIRGLDQRVRDLANKVDVLGAELTGHQPVEIAVKVAMVNVYLSVVGVLVVADQNAAETGQDVLTAWEHDGTRVAATKVSASITGDGITVVVLTISIEIDWSNLDTYIETIVKPETIITSQPANPTMEMSANFAFVSSGSNATFQCRLDGGDFDDCPSPKTYTALGVGKHTFCVVATSEGKTDPTPACYPWEVVTTPSPAWDVVVDYSAIHNPNGVWSYGRKWTVESSSLDLMTVRFNNVAWWFGNWGHGAPSVWDPGQWGTNNISLWAKNNSNGLPVVRWTSPEPGSYKLTGTFVSADSRGVDSFVYVVINGTIRFNSRITSAVQVAPFSFDQVALAQGDYVDFAPAVKPLKASCRK